MAGDYAFVRDADERICGLWIRDPRALDEPGGIEALLLMNSGQQLLMDYIRKRYRKVPNRCNSEGGYFVMFGSAPAPGESAAYSRGSAGRRGGGDTNAAQVDVLAEANQLEEEAVRLCHAAAFSKAVALAERVLAIREGALGTEHVDVAKALTNLGAFHCKCGAYDQAAPLFERALRIREHRLGPDHPDVAHVLNNMAELRHAQGQYSQAVQLHERALRIFMYAHGPVHQSVATSLTNLGVLFRELGMFDKARSRHEEALSIYEKVLGPEHRDVANSLNNLALCCVDAGDYVKAKALMERAVRISEDVAGADHLALAQPLSNLATLHQHLGSYEQAMVLQQRALTIRENAFGSEHPEIASSLSHVAAMYQSQGLYDRAAPLYERALGIRERMLGAEHPEVATSLTDLAELYRVQGMHGQAKRFCERALGIRERALGVDHPDVATSLHELAKVVETQGAYESAKHFYERALRIREAALGSDHREVATSLNTLATLYLRQGAYGKARPLYERALRIRENVLGPEHLDVATSLNDLAAFYRIQGMYSQAEPLHERALCIQEKLVGAEHPQVATSLNNLAVLYADQGAYSQAVPLLVRALHIHEKALGPDHPDVATSLNNLAALHRDHGTADWAQWLFEHALRINETALGAEHPAVATSLNNLASLCRGPSAHAQAAEFHERALRITEKALGSEHPDVAISLTNLAESYRAQGMCERARALYERALHVFEGTLGTEHPSIIEPLHGLAMLAWDSNAVAGAIQYFARALALQEQHLTLTLSTLPEPRKRQLLHTQQGTVEMLLSFHAHAAPDDVDALALALTASLRRKGRLLEEVASEQAALRRTLSPALQDELGHLQALRAELAARREGVPDPRQADALRTLAQEVARREMELSRTSAAFRAQTESPSIASVQATLPEHATLVEYVYYHRFDPRDHGQEWREAHYAAYILGRKGPPQWVALGEADRIEAAVMAARGALVDPKSEPHTHLRVLDELLVAPIRRLVGPLEHLLLSPDAALHLAPFAALVDPTGRYLVEDALMTYVTSGRDRVRAAAATKEAARSRPLVVAAPDYDGRCAPLPGALAEAEKIQGHFAGAELHTQQHATKDKLTGAQGPAFVHVATHGFFEAARTSTSLQATRSWHRRDVALTSVLPDPPVPRHDIEDALDDAGLIFAGTRPADSRLTAREISGIDLRGTQLVVLSACDTGIGQVAQSEGVYGLRRALAVAGAETQVVSLWKVDDDATSQLMDRYYARLRDGGGRSQALRDAQLELMHEDRYAHPFYWASFVPIGDEQPLRRGTRSKRLLVRALDVFKKLLGPIRSKATPDS